MLIVTLMSDLDAACEIDVVMPDPDVVAMVARWLIKTKPLTWVGKSSTRVNARPLQLFQDNVQDEPIFWFSHSIRYAPERGKRAGSKAPVPSRDLATTISRATWTT